MDKKFIITSILALVLSFQPLQAQELGNGRNRDANRGNTRSGTFYDRFTPVKAEFSTSRSRAESYADPNWKKLTYLQKAGYVKSVIDQLIEHKGYTYLSSNALLCIVSHESDFVPNWKNGGSTASGLGQVTEGTMKGFLKQKWFSPVIPGFRKDMSANAYRLASAKSIVEQLNLKVSTFHLKRLEAGTTNLETLIKRYRGSNNKVNQAYANKVLACKACLDKGTLTKACLDKAR